MWIAVRFNPARPKNYFLIGTIAAAVQFLSPDAVVYTIPFSAMILLFPPSGAETARWRLVLAWASGVAGTLAVGAALFGGASFWNPGTMTSGGDRNTEPIQILERLITGAPLLAALAVAATATGVLNGFRQRAAALTWEGNLPEILLFTGSVGILIFGSGGSSNIVYLLPFAFLLAFRSAIMLTEQVQEMRVWLPSLVALAIFVHLIPFDSEIRKDSVWLNFDQENVMTLVEDLTDPGADPVYDAIGIVPTRRNLNPGFSDRNPGGWRFNNHAGSPARKISDAPAAVVMILNQRVESLTDDAGCDFVTDYYVRMTDDFWVLGKVLAPGGGSFEIVHPGRYRVASLKGSDIAGTFPTGFQGLQTPETAGTVDGRLDGRLLSGAVVELRVGRHYIEAIGDCQPTVVWVGPRIDRIHRLHQNNHRQLFGDPH
jgi:hypothetical protein